MLLRCVLLSVVPTLCSSQYQMDNSMRADVTFNNDNDRFDVGNIISEQNMQFRDLPTPMDYDARRSWQEIPLIEVLKQDRRRYQKRRNQRRSFGGSEEEFVQSYQPRIVDNDNELEKYNMNLENFRRQKPPIVSRRRNSNKIVTPTIDTVNAPLPHKNLQGVLVKENINKKDRRRNSNKIIAVPTIDNIDVKYNPFTNKNLQGVYVKEYINNQSRRRNSNKIVSPTNDNANAQHNPSSNTNLQGVLVEEHVNKMARRSNNKLVTPTIDNANAVYNSLSNKDLQDVFVQQYIDTKGRRVNKLVASTNNNLETKSNILNKYPQGVVLNYFHGDKKIKNGRRTSGAKHDDDILLHYAVPLRMKIRGYVEMPGV